VRRAAAGARACLALQMGACPFGGLRQRVDPAPFEPSSAPASSFELAIAVAVGTFGLQSSEALAATVGPLIEVPALLALVYVSLWVKRRWWDDRDAQLAAAGEGRGAGAAPRK
jgi:hypothetical protein